MGGCSYLFMRSSSVTYSFSSGTLIIHHDIIRIFRKGDHTKYISRSNRISSFKFSFNFNDLKYSFLFPVLFRNHSFFIMVELIVWERFHTDQNNYRLSPLISACVILHRIRTPSQGRDMNFMQPQES